jgi:hypothetical protein
MRGVAGAMMTVDMGIAADALSDYRDQAKLEKRSPLEWPEQEIPGAIKRNRNRIRG